MNVIVICFDTLRADLVYGTSSANIEVPNLRRLMNESVVFEQCFAEGLPTIQVRRCLFTGRRSFPWRFHTEQRGVWPPLRGWHKIPEEQTTIAELLLDHGYATSLITDVPHLFKPTLNFARGFLTWDFIRGNESDPYRIGPVIPAFKEMQRHTLDAHNIEKHARLLQYFINIQGRKKEEDYFCAQVFSRAAQWVQDLDPGRPFFLWVDSFDPHEPWDPPTEYADRYSPRLPDLEPIGGIPPDCGPEIRNRVKALYYGEITLADKWLGVLLRKLDELNLWDDTIVMVVSDHGTELWDVNRCGKSGQRLFPFNTQQIWMIRHPKFNNGKQQRVSEFVQDTDFAPTILDMLSISHEPMDGISTLPLIQGKVALIRDHVITGFGDWASVRDDKWNYLVKYEDKSLYSQLYSVPEQINGFHNIASDFPQVTAKQQTRLEELLGEKLPATRLDTLDGIVQAPASLYWHSVNKELVGRLLGSKY